MCVTVRKYRLINPFFFQPLLHRYSKCIFLVKVISFFPYESVVSTNSIHSNFDDDFQMIWSVFVLLTFQIFWNCGLVTDHSFLLYIHSLARLLVCLFIRSVWPLYLSFIHPLGHSRTHYVPRWHARSLADSFIHFVFCWCVNYLPFVFKLGPISEVSKQPRRGELTFIEGVSKLQVCQQPFWFSSLRGFHVWNPNVLVLVLTLRKLIFRCF